MKRLVPVILLVCVILLLAASLYLSRQEVPQRSGPVEEMNAGFKASNPVGKTTLSHGQSPARGNAPSRAIEASRTEEAVLRSGGS